MAKKKKTKKKRKMSNNNKKDAGLSAVLSFFIPGVGQLYNGTFWRALFWLIITPGLWIGTGGLLGWICHFISAFTAYDKAQEVNEND